MTKHTDVYAPLLKGWAAKQLGPKPGDDLLAIAHDFGRPGKQSLALAMAMRPEGVSGSQIVMACGAPQNNHRRGLIAGGLFKRDNGVAANEQGHTVYKVTLTAKGEAARKRKAEAASKAALAGEAPAKPRKAAKAKRKAKGEAAPVTAQAAPEAPVTQGEAPVTGEGAAS